MGRTKKDRNHQRKIVKNSFLQKTCKTYGSDFKGSRKRTFTGGQIRKKLQRLKDKEIIGVSDEKEN